VRLPTRSRRSSWLPINNPRPAHFDPMSNTMADSLTTGVGRERNGGSGQPKWEGGHSLPTRVAATHDLNRVRAGVGEARLVPITDTPNGRCHSRGRHATATPARTRHRVDALGTNSIVATFTGALANTSTFTGALANTSMRIPVRIARSHRGPDRVGRRAESCAAIRLACTNYPPSRGSCLHWP
jgi:hypothetical protein